MNFFPHYRFYAIRCHAEHPIRLLTLIIGSSMCIAFAVRLLAVHEETSRIVLEEQRLGKLSVAARATLRNSSSAFGLPTFVSGTLVKTFNSIANDMQVPLNDVAYVLDQTTAVPYFRYRITMSSKADYAELRRFIAVLSSELPNVSLDSIRCSRANAAAPVLDCELAFSAFYAREGARG